MGGAAVGGAALGGAGAAVGGEVVRRVDGSVRRSATAAHSTATGPSSFMYCISCGGLPELVVVLHLLPWG